MEIKIKQETLYRAKMQIKHEKVLKEKKKIEWW